MGGDLFDKLKWMLVAAPSFLLAIILHEVAHGYAAYRLGDDTAKRAGHLTLSPLSHLDPVGTLMFVISSLSGFGFGWAKPVPVVMERLRHPTRDEVIVSLAGVATNLVQAVVWALLAWLSYRYFPESSPAIAVVIFCALGVRVNLLLLVFNLLPVPPLDGSRVAAKLLGIRDSSLVDRLAPLGFVVLVLFVGSNAFGQVMETVYVPLLRLFMPMLHW